MNHIRDQLEDARREAPDVSANAARLYERRTAKAKVKRLQVIVVASAIGLLPIAVGLEMVGGHSGSSTRAGNQIGPPTLDLRLVPGEFYYVRVDAGQGVWESWWALDDSGRLATVSGSWWGAKNGTYGPDEFYSDTGSVTYLSTDPTVLERQLRERVGPDGASPEPYGDWGGPIEWGLIRSIGELLDAPDVTPEQKAALMLVAADLDGVSVDLQARDPLGRRAILLTTNTERTTQRWWFDPESHQPLAMTGTFDETAQASGIARSMDTTALTRSFLRQVEG
jgi:hypothetical protein